jgi:hypothetical protein
MGNLISEDLLKTIPPLYSTEDQNDTLVYVKLFTPDSVFTWFIIECSIDGDTCYGYVQGFESELGYFSLEELKSIKGPLGLAVERDISFKPTALAIIRKSK